MTGSGLAVGVLGPLAVWRDGKPVELGAGRERSVLGLLVVHAGQVVAVDRFIDALWGDEPPPSAPHALQVHISNLRRRLEPARTKGTDGSIIVTERPGYRLRATTGSSDVVSIDVVSIDAAAFERDAAEARRALAEGRTDTADRLLQGALARWRGPAMADVSFEAWAQPEAARLDELRWGVTEDALAVALDLGRTDETIGALEAFTRTHPLRERAWALLAVARYRSGRQAEALRAIDEVRTLLRDELGLDPGPALRELQARILQQDPSLAGPIGMAHGPTALAVGTEQASDLASQSESASESPRGARHDEVRTVAALCAVVDHLPTAGMMTDDERLVVRTDIGARLVAAIERYGGEVLADGEPLVDGEVVHAVFGARVAHEDDAERAIRAGLDVADAIDGFGREVAEAFAVPAIAVRVAVACGLASVSARPDAGAAAVGPAAVASRMLGNAVAGSVLVHGCPRDQLAAAFDLGPDIEPGPDDDDLRGEARAHTVLGHRPDADKARGIAGLDVAVVGRDRELDLGRTALDAVAAGTGGIVLVTGEAGVGKSRLIRELRAIFDEAADPERPRRWLAGRSISYGDQLPYGPFRGLLQDWLELTGTEPEFRVRVRLQGRADGLLGTDAAEHVPFLGNLLGLVLDADSARRVDTMPADRLRSATFDAVAALLTRLADLGPVVIELDDVHWADRDSIELLGELLRLGESAAVLFVIAQRLERDHPSWDVHDAALRHFAHRTTELALRPLAHGDDGDLLDALVGAGTLRGAVRNEVLAAAEGNPFYVEELVRSLMASGALVATGTGWSLAGDATVTVPDRIDQVILSRIGRLPPSNREVLAVASVLGRQFDADLLARVVDDPDSLAPAVREALERVELLRETRRWPTPALRFNHALVQDAAYRTLPTERRRGLHARVARILDDADVATPPAVLAHHYGAAGDDVAAFRHHCHAAADAHAVHAQVAARAHYDDALRLAADLGPDNVGPDVVAELLFGRGRLHRYAGDQTLATLDLRAAAEAARRSGAAALELEILTELGLTDLMGESATAAERFGDALGVAERAGNGPGQAVLLGRLAIESVRALRFDLAWADAHRAVEVAGTGSDRRARARALDGLKLVLLSVGDLDGFVTAVDELEAILVDLDDKVFLQYALGEHGVVAGALGRFAEADAIFARAREINELVELRVDRPLLLTHHGGVLRAQGRTAEALATLEAAFESATAANHRLWTGWTAVGLALAHLDLLDPASALGVLAATERSEPGPPSDDQRLRAEALAARAHHLLGETDAMHIHVERFEALVSRVVLPAGHRYLYAFPADLAVAAALGDDDPARGMALADEVGGAARRSGWHEADAGARLTTATILATHRDPAAGDHAEVARSVAATVGLPHLHWRALAVLATVADQREAGAPAAAAARSEAHHVIDSIVEHLEPGRARTFVGRAGTVVTAGLRTPG